MRRDGDGIRCTIEPIEVKGFCCPRSTSFTDAARWAAAQWGLSASMARAARASSAGARPVVGRRQVKSQAELCDACGTGAEYITSTNCVICRCLNVRSKAACNQAEHQAQSAYRQLDAGPTAAAMLVLDAATVRISGGSLRPVQRSHMVLLCQTSRSK